MNCPKCILKWKPKFKLFLDLPMVGQWVPHPDCTCEFLQYSSKIPVGALGPIKLLIKENTPENLPFVYYALIEDPRFDKPPLTGRGVAWCEDVAIDIAKIEALERYCFIREYLGMNCKNKVNGSFASSKDNLSSTGFAAHRDHNIAHQNAFSELIERRVLNIGVKSIQENELLEMVDPNLWASLKKLETTAIVYSIWDYTFQHWIIEVFLNAPALGGQGIGSAARVDIKEATRKAFFEAYSECFGGTKTNFLEGQQIKFKPTHLENISSEYKFKFVDCGNRTTEFFGLTVVRAIVDNGCISKV